MINASNKILFLKDGKDLSDAVHEAIDTVCEVIREHNNFNGDPESIRVRDESITFIRFFNSNFRDEIPVLSKNDINKLYDLIGYSDSNRPSNDKIKELCLCDNNLKSERYAVSKGYFLGIKMGLQMVFIRLWKERVLLLPYDFEPPRCKYMSKENLRTLFFTPVSLAVRMQKSTFNPSLKDSSSKDYQHDDNRASYWFKLILASSWYEADDLSLDDFYEAKSINTGIVKSNWQIHLLIQLFINHFGEKLNFTKEEYLSREIESRESNNDTANANKARKANGIKRKGRTKAKPNDQKLLDGLISIYDKLEVITINELMLEVTKLTMSHLGNNESIFDKIYEQVLPQKYHNAVKYWLKMQRLYKGKKKYEDPTSLFTTLGQFNAYLFIYLPWWYANQSNQNKCPDYPDNLNKLNCEIFINRWTGGSSELPLDYISFVNLISQLKNWTNNTHYAMLHPLLMLLRWCERKKRRLPDADEFENLLDTDDLPGYTKYGHSKKTPLSRRLFKMFVRYCYALEKFQSQLVKKVEAGEFDLAKLKHLGGVATSFIYLEDDLPDDPRFHSISRLTQPRYLNLSECGLDRPMVSFDDEGGASYPINSFYRFFFDNEYLVNGENKTLIYPGDLHICLLAMETGIRANHLRWLDLDTFDMRVNIKMLDDYLHPLTVNTDKVKKEPWVSTVSSSVIRICLQQKKWRGDISNDCFNESIFYNGNKDTKFGAFRPLFSYSPKAGVPTNSVDDCFLALLLSFEQFLKDHGFEEEAMYKLRPKGHKYYGEINPEAVETKVTKEGHEFTPLTYAKRTTVHACRNSVVKEKTRYLPDSIVGKHITGQHPRLVTYYNLRDPEDHYDDQNRQWATKSGETNFNIPLSGEAFDREMPSNLQGGVMQKGINDDPVQAIDAYGLISIHLITDEDGNLKDGVSMIKAKKHLKLACNPTHFCPFDNVCPKEIVEELGEIKPCPICPYAISGINHLPAISAAKDAGFEEYTDAKEKLISIRKDAPKDLVILTEIEDRSNQLLMHAYGWEYREKELLSKRESIKKGFDTGEFTVGKPEFIANMLEPIYFKEDDNQAAYLLKRLRDCKAFPLLETKMIAAKFEMAKRKLMAVKDPRSALNFDVSMNPMKELYSLIQSYKELHGISNNQISQILNMTPQHLMEKLEMGFGLEFKNEVKDD